MRRTIFFIKKVSLSFIALCFVFALTISCAKSPEIVVQSMKMPIPAGQSVFIEELLPGEIADTKIEHVAYKGPLVQNISLSPDSVNMFVVVKGKGELRADTLSFGLVPESIAIPMKYRIVTINVKRGEVLHFVRFSKKLTEQDKKDLEAFPPENKYDVYFTRFSDCEPYSEAIKSPNTISRTVLPENIVPRVALGTVEAPGPDTVGKHRHAMLDQLFLGLKGNDVVVQADDAEAKFPEYSLLHIPLGSNHGVTVDKNKRMYYLWMDFFRTKEGQEWLKEHKPVSTYDD